MTIVGRWTWQIQPSATVQVAPGLQAGQDGGLCLVMTWTAGREGWWEGGLGENHPPATVQLAPEPQAWPYNWPYMHSEHITSLWREGDGPREKQPEPDTSLKITSMGAFCFGVCDLHTQLCLSHN